MVLLLCKRLWAGAVTKTVFYGQKGNGSMNRKAKGSIVCFMFWEDAKNHEGYEGITKK